MVLRVGRLLSTIGRIAALAVSSRSSRRSYYLRQVGGGYAGPAGMPGAPGGSVGTANKSGRCVGDPQGRTLNDRWRSAAKPDEIRQDRSS